MVFGSTQLQQMNPQDACSAFRKPCRSSTYPYLEHQGRSRHSLVHLSPVVRLHPSSNGAHPLIQWLHHDATTTSPPRIHYMNSVSDSEDAPTNLDRLG